MIVAALYFPQFHHDPTLTEWYGPGGSDWENLRSAKPRFLGHRVLTPGELGEYNLSDASVRVAQRTLASVHGIDAFCYYHYWSDGLRLLDVVERSILSRDLDTEMPFFLCWANHDWYRALPNGRSQELRLQCYSRRSFEAHADLLHSIFAHPAYVRIHGRPVMVVYDPLASPELRMWGTVLKAVGPAAPLILGVEWEAGDLNAILKSGFDGTVAPIPHLSRMVLPAHLRAPYLSFRSDDILIDADRLDEYLTTKDQELWRHARSGRLRIPTTYVGWDNSPRRRERATIVMGNDPGRFGDRMAAILRVARAQGQPLLLVNAWNEWGENCALEPSRELGRAFLEAILTARVPSSETNR